MSTEIQLIDGGFTPQEAIQLISSLIEVKIKFHEQKISLSDTEEDIKLREQKIKRLQHELAAMKSTLLSSTGLVHVKSKIVVEP
jgi:hypothetical protein